ncbi:MAG: transcription antitermination factor NusB [bacterium]
MSSQLSKDNQKYSQKYQREIALGTVLQFLYYQKFFLPLYLSTYFRQVLGNLIENYHKYNQGVWEIIYRSDYFVMNYMERALLLLLYCEIKASQIPEKVLVHVYIRLAKKYCRKNFEKLIPVFISYAKKNH